MADVYWLDDFSVLDLQLGSGDSVAAAVVQDVSIVPNVSIEHLYGADSIKAESRKQHEFSVDVDIGYSEWNIDLARQWLDSTAASDGSGDPISMADTSDPTQFKFRGEFDSANSGDTFSLVVDKVTFEEMPIIDASRGEYVQWDLSGTGEAASYGGSALP